MYVSPTAPRRRPQEPRKSEARERKAGAEQHEIFDGCDHLLNFF